MAGRQRSRAVPAQYDGRNRRAARSGDLCGIGPQRRGLRPDPRPLGRACRPLHRTARCSAHRICATHRATVVDSLYQSASVRSSNTDVKYGLILLYLVDRRASLLPFDATLKNVYDPYVFIRDAYLARRAFLVSDGKINEEPLIDPEPENSDTSSPPTPRAPTSAPKISTPQSPAPAIPAPASPAPRSRKVRRPRSRFPTIRGPTFRLPTALCAESPAHGSAEPDFPAPDRSAPESPPPGNPPPEGPEL